MTFKHGWHFCLSLVDRHGSEGLNAFVHGSWAVFLAYCSCGLTGSRQSSKWFFPDMIPWVGTNAWRRQNLAPDLAIFLPSTSAMVTQHMLFSFCWAGWFLSLSMPTYHFPWCENLLLRAACWLRVYALHLPLQLWFLLRSCHVAVSLPA